MTEMTKMKKYILTKEKMIVLEDNSFTLTIHAKIFRKQETTMEVRKMLKRMSIKNKVILDKDYLDTLITMHNLAKTHRLQGKFAEIAKIYEEILAKEKAILGERHLIMLVSMHNLARIYQE